MKWFWQWKRLYKHDKVCYNRCKILLRDLYTFLDTEGKIKGDEKCIMAKDYIKWVLKCIENEKTNIT